MEGRAPQGVGGRACWTSYADALVETVSAIEDEAGEAGRTAAGVLDGQSARSLRLVIAILLRCSQTLTNAGSVHKDIKPANILLERRNRRGCGRPGSTLPRALRAPASSLIFLQMIVGTLAYMARRGIRCTDEPVHRLPEPPSTRSASSSTQCSWCNRPSMLPTRWN